VKCKGWGRKGVEGRKEMEVRKSLKERCEEARDEDTEAIVFIE
jgi:hypothetical protein